MSNLQTLSEEPTILPTVSVTPGELDPIQVQDYYDTEYGVPQFFVVGATADFNGWRIRSITELNMSILYLASRFPWTRDMYDGPNPYDQLCAAYCFLDKCNCRETTNTSWTAADLKRDVERATGIYISEGYYVVAARLLGIKLRPTSDRKSFHLSLKVDGSYHDYVEAKYAARMSTPTTDSQLVGA